MLGGLLDDAGLQEQARECNSVETPNVAPLTADEFDSVVPKMSSTLETAALPLFTLSHSSLILTQST